MAEETKPIEETKTETPKAEVKKESKPAVAKESKKAEVKKEVIELEREYTIPLRKEVLKVQSFRKAKKGVKAIKQFLAKHMKVEDRDVRKVKVDMYLNEEVWAKGIKNPPSRIKVKAIKKDGIVYAELADIPDYVKFKMAKDKKRHAVKVTTPKHSSKVEETAEEKKDIDEKEKASQEAGIKAQKTAANTAKHTTQGSHTKNTQPRRKVLK